MLWPTRRPYRTSKLKFVQQHYASTTAAALARQLDRTPGSLRDLIHRFQLQKQGRP